MTEAVGPSETTAGSLMVWALSCRSVAADACIRAQEIPFGICGEQIGTETAFCPCTSIFLRQYNSSNTSSSRFIRVSPKLYYSSDSQIN